MWQRLFLSIFVTLLACLPAQGTSWPHAVPAGAGSALIYRPQVDSFDGNVIRGRAVVSYVAGSSSAPVLGTIWFAARVVTDRDDRTATLCGLNVTNIKFPPGNEQSAADVQSAVMAQATASRPVIPIEALAAVTGQSRQHQSEASKLNSQPPIILFATEPTVLVTIDGEPKLVRVEGTPLLKVANSPFAILLDPASKTYFLRGGTNWYSATEATGPFAITSSIPPTITAAFPASSGVSGSAPKVIVATQPTELLITDGPEQFASVPGTNLIYVSNTDDDIFVEIASQQIYVLLSGRWFSAHNQNGPWAYVMPTTLPVDFAMIPADSAKAHVLASIPGTAQNTAALTDYQLPQTAAVKTNARIPTIPYDGQPEFQLVEGTEVEYAVNTSSDVLKVRGRYYCCQDAVWYASDTALGPFVATATIPDAVYQVPPTNPLYRDTFVRSYYSDANMIWFGYYPGYLGSYLSNGTVVWGTGWNYQPWFGKLYFPRATTWGYNARYNAATGSWRFHVAAAGPQGWIDVGRGAGSQEWWGAAGYLERGEESKKVVRANVYSRDSTRLAIDPRREALVDTKTPVQVDTGAHGDRDTFFVSDSAGLVYKRDLSGYQRYDGAAGWSRADAGLTKDLDRQMSVTGSAFGRGRR